MLSEEGKDVEAGILAISRPWPGMLRGIYGDNQRYKQAYWSKWPGKYFPGDGAKIDKDGYYWILGRIDDVVNVAGHRIVPRNWRASLLSMRLSRKRQLLALIMRLKASVWWVLSA